MVEHGERTKLPITDYLDFRMRTILAKPPTLAQRAREITFFIRGDRETQQRAALPVLNPAFAVGDPEKAAPHLTRVSSEGQLYPPRWLPRSEIPEEAIILGRFQLGRNYSLSPPKKHFVELEMSYVIGGLEPAVRQSEHIARNYRVEDGQSPGETNQLLEVLRRAAQLRIFADRLPSLTEEDLKKIVTQNIDFLEKTGLIRARAADKQRMAQMLMKGFTDEAERKNPLAAYMRIFSVSLAARKRLERVVPYILSKQVLNLEMLKFERDLARSTLQDSVDKLQEPQTTVSLLQISQDLLAIKARPYLPAARKAVEHFGVSDLPKRSINAQVAKKRLEPTVAVYAKEGKFKEARDLINKVQDMLQLVLEKNADYQNVRPSKKNLKGHRSRKVN